MPRVEVPPPYRGPTHGHDQIEVEATTVGECLRAVGVRYPGFDAQIFDANGSLHRFVTLFVNGDEIERKALDMPVSGSDEIRILAAIAGG